MRNWLSIMLVLVIPLAYGLEPLCPGGSSPRSDVVWCASFDELDNCAAGTELQCWLDNGFDGLPPYYGTGEGKFQIQATSDAAVGPGAVIGRARPGSTGAGYTRADWKTGYPEIWYRWYVRYDDYFRTYHDHHGPGLATLEMCQDCYHLYTSLGDLSANQPNAPELKNGRWYLVEMHIKSDTACTDVNDPRGCNGVYELWIDEQLVANYTNLNWGGVRDGKTWSGAWGPRDYYHVNVAPTGHTMLFDNFVAATDGYIGPAASENPRGEEDPYSPYINRHGIEPFYGGKFAGDCSLAHYLGTNAGYAWGVGGALSQEEFRPDSPWLDECDGGPRPEQSAKFTATTSEDRAGVSFTNHANRYGDAWHRYAIHGWMYLPSTNDHTQTPVLNGFASYACGSDCSQAQWGNYVAMTIRDGKWALLDRRTMESPRVVNVSAVAPKYDTWQEFELFISEDGYANLMIDGERIFFEQPVDMTPSWFNNDRNPSSIFGILHQDSSADFTMYVDDISVGGPSFWSCDGWNPDRCPYGAEVPSTPSLQGDVNGDGEVNLLDLLLVEAQFGTDGSVDVRTDLNSDGAVNLFDLVMVGVRWNPGTVLPPEAWVYQDFEDYADIAALDADTATWAWYEAKDGYVVEIDQGAAYPGLTKSLRYDWLRDDPCVTMTNTRQLLLPSAEQELWIEFAARWSENFNTTPSPAVCAFNAGDHKTFFATTQQPNTGRWELKVGAQNAVVMRAAGTNFAENDERRIPGSTLSLGDLWDEQWHVIRLYFRHSSNNTSSDGAMRLWVDGELMFEETGINTVTDNGSTDAIAGLRLGSTQQKGPAGELMSMWWGYVAAYREDPVW